MFLRQIFDSGLAQYSYLIGCQAFGEAIVIDPQRDVDRYHKIALENGLRITAAADTHIHADYLSGTRELGRDKSVTLYLSAEGGDEWQYRWAEDMPNVTLLHDKDTFRIGNIFLKAIHTPGHTPEHLAFAVTDGGAGADSPIGIATGDFVFVGDVGRPDLLESAAGQKGAMEPAARSLYQSLLAFQETGDEVQIWPAHGAGSACGKALGAVPVSTVGYENRYNKSWRQAIDSDEEGFVGFILSGQPEPPLYWARMKKWNRDGAPILQKLPQPQRMTGAEVAALRGRDDAPVLLDARRDRSAFIDEHIAGSLFAPAGEKFVTVAGSFVEPETALYLLMDHERDVDDLVRGLIRIGLDKVSGFAVADEVLESPELADQLTTLQGIELADILEEMKEDPDAVVLDVRTAAEFEKANVPGARHMPYTRLADRLHEIPSDRRVLVHCGSGLRASFVAALLEREGRDVIHVDGMFDEWLEARRKAEPAPA